MHLLADLQLSFIRLLNWFATNIHNTYYKLNLANFNVLVCLESTIKSESDVEMNI